MKFIWPPLTRALDERKKNIADGLAAGEKGRRELELGEKKALETIKKAKQDAAEVIALADKRASEIADEAKEAAKAEADRIVAAARADIEQEVNRAKEQLRSRCPNWPWSVPRASSRRKWMPRPTPGCSRPWSSNCRNVSSHG